MADILSQLRKDNPRYAHYDDDQFIDLVSRQAGIPRDQIMQRVGDVGQSKSPASLPTSTPTPTSTIDRLRAANPRYRHYSDEQWVSLVAENTQSTPEEAAAKLGYRAPEPAKDDFLDIPPAEPATTTDYLKGVASGVNKLVSGIGYLAESVGADDTGKAIREFGNRGAEYWNQQMTEGGKQAASSKVFEDDDDPDSIVPVRLSDKWGQAIMMGAAQSLPSMLAAALPGAAITKGIQSLAKLGLAGGAGATIPLLAGTAAPVTTGANVLARIPSAVGFGAAEGITAGAMNAADFKTSIESMPFEELGKSPVFQVLAKEHGPEKARSLLAEQAASDVFGKTALSTGAIGAITGGGALAQAYQKITAGAKGGLLMQTAKGAGAEALQETPQSGGEALIQNVATRDFLDPSKSPTEGVLAEALSGGAIGGFTGGIFGAGGAIQSKAQDRADRINAERTKLGLDKIAQSGTVDDAIQAAAETVSQRPVTPGDVFDDAIQREDLLRRTEAFTQPQGAANEEEIQQEANAESIPGAEVLAQPEGLGPQGEAIISRLAGEVNPLTETEIMPPEAGQGGGSLDSILGRQQRSSRDTEIVLPDNTSLPAQWDVVDASQVQATIKEGANQPRDRRRAASEAQIAGIANNPNYSLVSDSPVMDVGAPVMDSNNAIVAGNGRFEGLSRAYESGTATQYRERLMADAARKGIDPAIIAGMERPVLVRRVTQPIDTRNVAIKSNSGLGLQYSSLELAKIDSERMKGLADIEVSDNGDIALTPQNTQKLRDAFFGYDAAELGSLIGADGMLSQDGVRRVKSAILYSAYGDSPTLGRMIESTDSDIRNIVGALTKAAGDVARVQKDIKSGAIPAELDVTNDLIEATEKIAQLRAQSMPVDAYLAQQSMLGDDISEESKEILRFLSDNMRSQKKMVAFIKSVYDGIGSIDNISANLFGDTPLPTKSEIIQHAKQQTAGQSQQADIFNRPASQVGAEDRQKSQTESSDAAGNEQGEKFSRSPDERLKDRERSKQLEESLRRGGFNFTIKSKDVRDFAASDRSRQNEAVAAEQIAKIFGKRITWIEANGPFEINGVMVPNISDTIFIDVRTDKLAHAVMGHELSHHMEHNTPEVYRDMVAALTEIIQNTEGYAKKYGIEGAKDEDIIVEIVGDIMGDNFTQPEFWGRVAAYNPNAFRKIADTIVSWIKKFVTNSRMRGLGSEQWVTDASKAQDIIAKAVAQYANTNPNDRRAGSEAKFARSEDNKTPLSLMDSEGYNNEVNAKKETYRHLQKNFDFGVPNLDYGNIEQRPDTTERQRELGRSGHQQLLERSIDRGQGSLLGAAIAKDFREHSGATLVGQTVRSTEDLAVLAQVLRDPRFETFRIFYTKGDQIVHHTGVTSRLPAASNIYSKLPGETDKQARARYFETINLQMQQSEADGYYLLHNHPSGKADASNADINLTGVIAEAMPGFKGHVIIDHNEYGVINIEKDGADTVISSDVFDKELTGGYSENNPIVPHNALRRIIGGPEELAEVGKLIERKDGYFTLIGLGARMNVLSIAEFPRDLLNKPDFYLLGALRRFARHSGADAVAAVGDESDGLDKLHMAVDKGVLLDVIDSKTGENSRRATGAKKLFEIGKSKDRVVDVREFAGERAETADKMALASAQERLANGEDAETVRQETGWHRGVDGKWRFEIDDSKAFVKKSYANIFSIFPTWGDIIHREKSKSGNEYIVISDMLSHPKLFAAYPELKNIRVTSNRNKDQSSFYHKSPGKRYGEISIFFSNKPNRVLSTLLHELQHAIQKEEEFATGGSPSDFDHTQKLITSFADFVDNDPSLKKLQNQKNKYIAQKQNNKPGNDEYNEAVDTIEYLDNQIKDRVESNADFMQLKRFGLDEIGKLPLKDNGDIDRIKAYMRLFGEIEARNTQARQNLTAEERRATSPQSTQDIPDSEAIVVYNGKVMKNAPPPANALFSKSVRKQSGITVDEIRKATNKLQARWVGSVKISVVQSVSDIPQHIHDRAEGDGVPGDADGLYDPKSRTAYLIADNLDSPERAVWVALHEVVGHAGLRALGKPVNESIKIAGANKFVSDLSKAIAKDRGEDYDKLHHSEEAIAELSAAILSGDIDEILSRYGVEVPQNARKNLEGIIQRVIEAIRRFVAQVTGETTDAQVRELIMAAKVAIESRSIESIDEAEKYISQSLRIIKSGYRTVNDFIIPETPEYADNLTGDLAYVPENDDIPVGPLRVEVGIVVGPHRGRGIMHMADNVKGDSNRLASHETGDLAEDLIRNVVAVMKGVRSVHNDGRSYVFVNPGMGKSIVANFRNGYYSVITERPYKSDPVTLWGTPEWSGRLTLPRPDASTASPSIASHQGNESSNLDRHGLEGTSREKFTIPEGNEKGQDRKQPVVAVKKRRNIEPPKFSRSSTLESSLRSIPYPASAGEPISVFKTAEKIKLHKDYAKAKSGDVQSAIKLVKDLVPIEKLNEAKERFGSNVIYLPVVLKEKNGTNRIPHALAALYASNNNSLLDTRVFEREKAFHTGMNMMERLISRASFGGGVKPDAKYVLVDDVTTVGATLSDLASYIQDNGGIVVGSVLLTNAMRTGSIFPLQKTISRLEAQYGNTIREIFGIEPSALTKEESQYLLGFRTDDELRNRAATARDSRRERIASKRISGTEDSPRLSRASTLARAGVNTAATQAASSAGTLPEETGFQAFRRKTQDAMLRFKVMQDWLTEQGVNLTEAANVYQRENISKGKTANKIEDFRSQQLEPLIKEIAKAKFTLSDVTTYLEAVHIPEANARMRQIHNDPNATANGITDAQAQQVLADFQAMPNFQEFERLANELRAIGAETLDMRLNAGLISQEQYDAYNNTYKNWVPLRGNMNKQSFGKGMSVSAKDKRRFGHGFREDEFILENLVADRERAITQIEKNKVVMSLLEFLMQSNNPEIGTIDKPEKMAVMKDHSYAVEYKGRTVGSFQNKGAADAAVIKILNGASNLSLMGVGSILPADLKVVKTFDPHVTMMAKPMLQDNEVVGYVNGHAIRLQLNDPLLARAATNGGIDQVGSIIGAAREFNRFLSKSYTSLNPEFVITNVMRDLYSGSIVLAGKRGAQFTGKVMKNYFPSIRELWKARNDPAKSRWVERYRKAGGNVNSAWLGDLERVGEDAMKALHEFAGAKETYRQVFAELTASGASKTKAQTVAISKASAAKLRALPVFGKLFRTIERVNAVAENSLRLAAFRTAIESGESDQQAAFLSKELINFNRHGELNNTMSALYLFYNPAVQSIQLTGEALFSSKHKAQVWSMVGALTTLSFLLAEIGRGDDDDEEREYANIPDYVKDRNLVFKFGDTQFTMAVAYGWGWFHSFGRLMSDYMHGEDGEKIAVKLAASFVENFSPVGNPVDDGENETQFMPFQLLPTVPKMIIGPSVNLNSMGREIHPKRYSDSMPDSQLASRSVRGTVYQDLADYLNEVTGGAKYEPGRVSVSPDVIKFWVTSITGGAGKFVSDSVTGGMSAASGIAPSLRDTPIARRFARESGVEDSRAAFWKSVNEVKVASERFRKAIKDGDVYYAQESMDKKGKIIGLVEYASASTKLAASYRDSILSIHQDETLSKVEKKTRIREIENAERKVYDEFLSMFDVSKSDGN
jgi:orotate phosphoribosyltransferase